MKGKSRSDWVSIDDNGARFLINLNEVTCVWREDDGIFVDLHGTACRDEDSTALWLSGVTVDDFVSILRHSGRSVTRFVSKAK